jgi:phage/plasmid-associated DNA primase
MLRPRFSQEFSGYALTTDVSHEIALWLCGPPGGGRSTFITGLEAMLGEKVGTLGLGEIERSRFALADILARPCSPLLSSLWAL